MSEKIKKRALPTIYGYDLTYQQLLEISGLPRLEERREKAFARFAEKTSKNPKYSPSWFPLRNNNRTTRSNNPYLEEIAVGNRLYKSPLFADVY